MPVEGIARHIPGPEHADHLSFPTVGSHHNAAPNLCSDRPVRYFSNRKRHTPNVAKAPANPSSARIDGSTSAMPVPGLMMSA